MPYLQSNGNSLYYKETGSGPVVVLISGIGADHRDWGLQHIFLKKYFRVISIDNMSIGKSSGNAEDITIEGMALDIDALLKSMKIDFAHIIGHSMGAMIAMEFAIKNPSKVLSLILCSLPFYNLSSPIRAINELKVFLDTGRQKLFVKKFISCLFSSKFKKSDQFKIIDAFIFKKYKKFNLHTIQNQFKSIGKWKRTCEFSLLPKCPCLVLYGSEDKFISLATYHLSLSELIPSAAINIVKGGGHALHIEKAKEFNNIVCRFIKGQEDIRRCS